MISPPKVDTRTAEDLYSELTERLRDRRSGLEADPFAEALLRIFSRYGELIIERLNRVPDKNYLAFLDRLGLSPVPPSPARTILSFEPVPRMPQGRGTVPRHTKVAASGGPAGPIVFETTRSLELTSARLAEAMSYDPRTDGYSDHPALLSVVGSPGEAVFIGANTAVHEFFLGQREIFGTAGITELRLRIELEAPLAVSGQPRVQWFIPGPTAVPLLPILDTTAELSHSGEVVFHRLPPWPPHPVGGQTAPWLGCRWLAAVSPAGESGSLRLPRIRTMAVAAARRVDKIPIARACCNGQLLDISKDFFPLGETPRFGDVLYLSSPEFAKAGAEIVLGIGLTNPASAGDKSPIRPTTRQGKPVIQWEAWNGERWVPLACRDGTQGLTEDGAVSFRLPEAVAETLVAGQSGHWLRARLAAGHYNIDPAGSGAGWPVPAAAPSIRQILVASSLQLAPRLPDAVLRRDALRAEPVAMFGKLAFDPFHSADISARALYLGFRAEAPMAGQRIDLYFQTSEPETPSARDANARQRRLIWQAWDGGQWVELVAGDETQALARSGMVELALPENFVPWTASSRGPDLHWLRILWPDGEASAPPRLRRILLNTVPAEHVLTLENEVLGSSSGLAHQVFRTARTPIVGAVRLEVREPPLSGAGWGKAREVWVPWREVSDFLASGPLDRHFVVDRLTGEIRFGDGGAGLVPPPGGNNIRLVEYRSGGGAGGNLPKQALTQLRSGVPFVKGVTNLEAATGGLDTENPGAMLERGSRRLRHRSRAVTPEDYEDLAREASPAVVRAKCYPGRNLAERGAKGTPGMVSLALVVHGGDGRPGADLLGRVQAFLEQRRMPFGELVVVPPAYVAVSVKAEVASVPGSGAAALAAVCEQRLVSFLNPVTGGEYRRGWPFGSLPKPSDLYAVLEAIPELAYVHSLTMRTSEEHPGLLRDGTYLVRSGSHSVGVVA